MEGNLEKFSKQVEDRIRSIERRLPSNENAHLEKLSERFDDRIRSIERRLHSSDNSSQNSFAKAQQALY